MKKHVSLLLALVMALSLCVTALAESTTETATVRLVGDAADQVVNLKDGQKIRSGKDMAVRLNVQSDPGTAEYTVMLNGEPVEPDHSTSRYHFYYLPHEQLAAQTVTLDVSQLSGAVSIATAAELKAFRDRVNGGETEINAVLTADIDLNKENWEPIGSSSSMYAGTFDGAGHTITGLNVTGDNNGLFKMTGEATIQNLTISDSTIATGGDFKNYGGAFVGLVKGNTTLINCHTTDTVTVSGGIVGGLLGGTNSSGTSVVLTMERCSNAATVNGNATSLQGGVGGLIGHLRNGANITNSCNTGAVTNKSTSDSAPVGGLVGSVYSSSRYKTPLKLTNVYNTGTVAAGGSGTAFAGGLVGNSDWGFDITNAYGTMTVKIGDSYGGIIVGTVKNDVTVSNIYSELIRDKNTDCHVFLNDSIDKMAPVENNKMFHDTEMKAADQLLAKLGDGFAEDTGSINNGYPVLSWQNTAPAAAAQLTVSVGSAEKVVELPADGSTDAAAPTEITVELSNPGESAVMDRIYFKDLSDGISLGTDISSKDGKLTGTLTKLDAGYTGTTLFFSKTPAAVVKRVQAVWTDGTGANHYYTVKLVRAALSGTALGPNGSGYQEDSPGGMSSFNADTGYISGNVQYGPVMIYGALKLYTDGKMGGDNIAPDWAALAASNNNLYYLSGGTQANFARPGYYWIPVSNGTIDGLLPMRASLYDSAVNATIIPNAEAAATAGVSSDAKAVLNAAVAALKDKTVTFSSSLYLKPDGSIPTDAGRYTEIQARTFFGAFLYGDSLYEKDLNTALDLTAICTAWGTNADLAAQQFEAYQRILNMDGGIHACIEIRSLADRDLYQKIRQAKWDVIHAADLDAINAVLTGLNLQAITPAEPEILLGDINGDGKISLADAGLLVQYVNKLTTLTEQQLSAADVNGDGKITLADAGLLVQYVNKFIDAFPSKNAG